MPLYFDHAASSPLSPAAQAVLFASFEHDFANPASAHSLGKKLTQKIEAARAHFQAMIGGEQGNLVFVSSATEANNWVVQKKSQASVLYSPADHPSLTQAVETFAAKKIAYPLHMTGKLRGLIDLDAFRALLKAELSLVCLTWVNGQNGIVQPISELVKLIRARAPHAHIHVDGAQGLGKLPLHLGRLDVDSIAFSGHKMGGPKGIGALWFKAKVELEPLLVGGGHENGYRASTLATPLILAFTEALKVWQPVRQVTVSKQLEQYHTYLKKTLTKLSDRISFPFEPEHLYPGILCFIVDKFPSDVLLRHLEQKNIYLSSSSACSSKIKGFNPVFSAMGIPETQHKFVLRFSMGPDTSLAELESFTGQFKAMMDDLGYLV